ncbi:hypothetical protein VDGL01_12335 [Verticillium dahliae]
MLTSYPLASFQVLQLDDRARFVKVFRNIKPILLTVADVWRASYLSHLSASGWPIQCKRKEENIDDAYRSRNDPEKRSGNSGMKSQRISHHNTHARTAVEHCVVRGALQPAPQQPGPSSDIKDSQGFGGQNPGPALARIVPLRGIGQGT